MRKRWTHLIGQQIEVVAAKEMLLSWIA